jgi:hypothetical protein
MLNSEVSHGGHVSVRNSSGTETAGTTGTVFGLIKSFRVPDPTNPDRFIKYTSLEGPEAAIYVRGTAGLVNGRAYVQFPGHFSALASLDSVTVTLTPKSAASRGLAAQNVTEQGFEVVELFGGIGDYSFDYGAYAVRAGSEDYEVYLDKKAVEESMSPMTSALESMKQASEAMAQD